MLVKSAFFILLAAVIPISSAEAVDIRFTYIGYHNSDLTIRLDIVDSLPADLSAHIDKGAPIAFEYRIEIWKSRPGWFDRLAGAYDLIIRLRYDTWEKKYTILKEEPIGAVEHTLGGRRETFDEISGTGRISIPLDDTSGEFYCIGKLNIKTMSFANFREVESWLKGEISSAKKPELESASNRLGEFIFNTAIRISGLKNISKEIRTEKLEMTDLPIISE